MLDVARSLQKHYGDIHIFQSPKGTLELVDRIDVRREEKVITEKYDLILSIHCKQFFPATLVNAVRCVNVHPGFNPYNRGWFPQVFSLINGLPAGVTIHEMDEKLDHGPIIAQEKCTIKPWDTSESLYVRILELENAMLWQHYESIKNRDYIASPPFEEGNLNTINDFEEMKKMNLNHTATFGEFLNLLRALSHGEHRNAYFLDKDSQKIFVRVILEKEDA